MVTVLVKKPNSAMSVMLRTEAILPISEKLLTSYFMPVSSFISFCSSRYDYFPYFRAIPSWRYSTWLQHLSIQYHLSQWSLVYLLLKYDGVLEWKYKDFSEPCCEGCWVLGNSRLPHAKLEFSSPEALKSTGSKRN